MGGGCGYGIARIPDLPAAINGHDRFVTIKKCQRIWLAADRSSG